MSRRRARSRNGKGFRDGLTGALAPWSEPLYLTKTAAQLTAVGAILLITPANAASLTLTISGATPNAGTVYTALCTDRLSEATCRPFATAEPADTVVTMSKEASPGDYAVVAFQDTDGDGRMTKNWMGRPKEPYALSNAPTGFPTFAKARITLGDEGLIAPLALRQP